LLADLLGGILAGGWAAVLSAAFHVMQIMDILGQIPLVYAENGRFST
jgi:hypothetical protein